MLKEIFDGIRTVLFVGLIYFSPGILLAVLVCCEELK
jgi:hypothetical protein